MTSFSTFPAMASASNHFLAFSSSSSSSSTRLFRSFHAPSLSRRNSRAEMTSSSATAAAEAQNPLPPLPDRRVVVGCGGLGLDYLATVEAFPKPDDKIRSTSSMVGFVELCLGGQVDTGPSSFWSALVHAGKNGTSMNILKRVQGGGNAGNALTGAARLGLIPRLISKVADDAPGKSVLAELKADGIDTSYIVVSKKGNSPFSYIIVDKKTKTRTCIHTPGHPAMVPGDLSQSSLLAALDGARIFYSDGRLHETALVIAKEATRMQIPILIDAERKREGLDDLLNLADYVVCSAKFPQAWTEASTIASALVSMLLRLPNIKFIIVTLGEDGCMMLERSIHEVLNSEQTDIDGLLESLKKRIDSDNVIPTCISSKPMQLTARGIGTVNAKLLLGTAEVIPPSELIDTTGAGDAFVGAILYAICVGMPPEKMLPFAAQVAAAGCRALGARSGLPLRTNPRLVPFLC